MQGSKDRVFIHEEPQKIDGPSTKHPPIEDSTAEKVSTSEARGASKVSQASEAVDKVHRSSSKERRDSLAVVQRASSKQSRDSLVDYATVEDLACWLPSPKGNDVRQDSPAKSNVERYFEGSRFNPELPVLAALDCERYRNRCRSTSPRPCKKSVFTNESLRTFGASSRLGRCVPVGERFCASPMQLPRHLGLRPAAVQPCGVDNLAASRKSFYRPSAVELRPRKAVTSGLVQMDSKDLLKGLVSRRHHSDSDSDSEDSVPDIPTQVPTRRSSIRRQPTDKVGHEPSVQLSMPKCLQKFREERHKSAEKGSKWMEGLMSGRTALERRTGKTPSRNRRGSLSESGPPVASSPSGKPLVLAQQSIQQIRKMSCAVGFDNKIDYETLRKEQKQANANSMNSVLRGSHRKKTWANSIRKDFRRGATLAQDVVALIEDIEKPLEVVFAPGGAGFVVDFTNGVLQSVTEGEPAHLLGVCVGMRILTIDGEPYSEESFRAAALGTKHYEVTFQKVRMDRMESDGQNSSSSTFGDSEDEENVEEDSIMPTAGKGSHDTRRQSVELRRGPSRFVLPSARGDRLDRLRKLALLRWTPKSDYRLRCVSDKELQRLAEAFRRYDYDHSGCLDGFEFQDAIADLGLKPNCRGDRKELVRILKLEGGELDFVQFCTAVSTIRDKIQDSNREGMWKAFKNFAVNSKGDVKGECALCLESLMDVFASLSLSPESNEERLAFLNAVVECDVDGSGMIDWSEFQPLVMIVREQLYQSRREREIQLAEKWRLKPDMFMQFRSILLDLHDTFLSLDANNSGALEHFQVHKMLVKFDFGPDMRFVIDICKEDPILEGIFHHRETLSFPVILTIMQRFRDMHEKMGGLDLRNIFDAYDIDQSGDLGLEEIVQLLKELDVKVGSQISMDEVEAIYHKADYDGSGTIEYEEFQALYRDIREVMAANKLRQGKFAARRVGLSEEAYWDLSQVFNMIDLEGCGSVTFDDMVEALTEIGVVDMLTTLNNWQRGRYESDAASRRYSFEDFLNLMKDSGSLTVGINDTVVQTKGVEDQFRKWSVLRVTPMENTVLAGAAASLPTRPTALLDGVNKIASHGAVFMPKGIESMKEDASTIIRKLQTIAPGGSARQTGSLTTPVIKPLTVTKYLAEGRGTRKQTPDAADMSPRVKPSHRKTTPKDKVSGFEAKLAKDKVRAEEDAVSKPEQDDEGLDSLRALFKQSASMLESTGY